MAVADSTGVALSTPVAFMRMRAVSDNDLLSMHRLPLADDSVNHKAISVRAVSFSPRGCVASTCHLRRRNGFTLVELIVIILLLGILSMFAAPRFLNTAEIDAFGFHNETLAYLRYAQKTAIAQRRTVCVGFAASSMTLSISTTADTLNCTASGALIGPKGESGIVTINARTGVMFDSAAMPTAFYFDALGQPITVAGTGAPQARQTFKVAGVPRTIKIEATTGYVHE